MTADLRVFVVTDGGEPSTCVGAAAARAEATQRVGRGESDVRIVNAASESFRWWPELCAEPGCYAPAAESKTTCAAHVEPRRARGRGEVDRAARRLVEACERAEAAGAAVKVVELRPEENAP